MSRCPTALGVDGLSFLRSRPAAKQPSRVGMRGIFHERYRDDSRGAFREHVIHRRPLFLACRIVMRVTSETCRRLTCDQQLGELRMSFVKLDIVCSDLSKNRPRLLDALMLMRQADENFIVPGFSDQ